MEMLSSSHLINPHIRIDPRFFRISTGTHFTDDDNPKQAGIYRDIELLYTESDFALFGAAFEVFLNYRLAGVIVRGKLSLPAGAFHHNPVREDK